MKAINLTILLMLGAAVLALPGGAGEMPRASVEYVRVGYSASLFGEVDLQDAKLAMDSWTGELAKLTDMKPQTLVFTTLAEVKTLIKNREVDLVAIDCLDYLNMRGQGDLEPALVGMVQDQVGSEFVLLVNRSQGISRLHQLRGKAITIQGCRGTETIPRLWLDTLLKQQGLANSNAFFGSIKTVKKSSQAVLPVFFSQADAAVTTRQAFETLVELNPQMGKSLEVIAQSPRYLQTLLTIRKSLPGDFKAKIIDAALRLGNHPRGSQILNLFRAGKIIPFNPTFLKNLEELAGKSS